MQKYKQSKANSLELKALNKLIKQALKFRFYQKKYKNYLHILPLKKLSDFSQLPTTTREDFFNYKAEYKPAYIMQNRKNDLGEEPNIFFTKKELLNMIEYEWQKFNDVGVKKNDIVSVIDFSINHSVPMTMALINHNIQTVMLEGEVEEIYADIFLKKVSVIFTHIRMLNKILNIAEKKPFKSSSLRLVITSGETIDNLELVKNRVKKNLKAILIDTVGTRQLCTYAIGNVQNSRYSFVQSKIYPELLSVDEKNIEKEVVITPFWKSDFPLIRFSTGDIVKLFDDCSFKKIGYRKNNDIKIGSKMFSLEKIYWETKFALHNQYFIDRLLWKILPQINFSIVLTKIFDNDVIAVFVEKKKFIMTMRKTSMVSRASFNLLGFPSTVVLISNEQIHKIIKNQRYADIRYITDKKIRNKINKILTKYI